MKVLLDTHVWLWYLVGDRRLTDKHCQVIEDEATELYLSSISIWEAYLLIEKGKIDVTGSPNDWIQEALRIVQVREAVITFAVAMRSRKLKLDYEDPADRFIAATSIEMKIPLLTYDKKLLACSEAVFHK